MRVQEESIEVIRGSKRSMRSENSPSRRTVSVETQTDITLPERTTVIWNCHCVSADSIVDQHPDEAQEVDGDVSNIQEEAWGKHNDLRQMKLIGATKMLLIALNNRIGK